MAKVKVQGVTPFLWFEKDCEKAAEFYVSLLQDSRIVGRMPMGCTFELAGQTVMALNGGPTYTLSPAFSFHVSVKTQAEVDTLWEKLIADGGQESQCGWLVDRFGVSWQIIPERLGELLAHEDPRVTKAAVDAMMQMGRIDIAALDAAASGVAGVEGQRRRK